MDIVKLLLEKDADVHAKTHGGKTALHGAVVQKRDEVVNILLVRPNPTESLARALLKLGLFCCAPGRRGESSPSTHPPTRPAASSPPSPSATVTASS